MSLSGGMSPRQPREGLRGESLRESARLSRVTQSDAQRIARVRIREDEKNGTKLERGYRLRVAMPIAHGS
jgi:hypothetical protein